MAGAGRVTYEVPRDRWLEPAELQMRCLETDGWSQVSELVQINKYKLIIIFFYSQHVDEKTGTPDHWELIQQLKETLCYLCVYNIYIYIIYIYIYI